MPCWICKAPLKSASGHCFAGSWTDYWCDFKNAGAWHWEVEKLGEEDDELRGLVRRKRDLAEDPVYPKSHRKELLAEILVLEEQRKELKARIDEACREAVEIREGIQARRKREQERRKREQEEKRLEEEKLKEEKREKRRKARQAKFDEAVRKAVEAQAPEKER